MGRSPGGVRGRGQGRAWPFRGMGPAVAVVVVSGWWPVGWGGGGGDAGASRFALGRRASGPLRSGGAVVVSPAGGGQGGAGRGLVPGRVVGVWSPCAGGQRWSHWRSEGAVLTGVAGPAGGGREPGGGAGASGLLRRLAEAGSPGLLGRRSAGRKGGNSGQASPTGDVCPKCSAQAGGRQRAGGRRARGC